MPIPNYRCNNLINLVSSIINGLGGKNHHPDISQLTAQIKTAKHIVLLVIDGMGSDSLARLGKNSFLQQKKQQDLSTVFPSTTSAAITSILTGTTPQEHGVTSWFTYFSEVNNIIAILPAQDMAGKKVKISHTKLGIPKCIFQQLPLQSHIVIQESLASSSYTRWFSKNAQTHGYRTFPGLLRNIEEIIRNDEKSFTYAYWGGFDKWSHFHGKEDPKSKKHLQQIDESLRKFASKTKRTDTLLLITADHGQVTSKPKEVIFMRDPLFNSFLSIPVCGEPRAAFCYVLPEKKAAFEKYVKQKLSKYCSMHHSQDMLHNHYFGEGPAHRNIYSRIGNYILLLKDKYVFVFLAKKQKAEIKMIGNHGGLSDEEMIIPLIKIRC